MQFVVEKHAFLRYFEMLLEFYEMSVLLENMQEDVFEIVNI